MDARSDTGAGTDAAPLAPCACASCALLGAALTGFAGAALCLLFVLDAWLRQGPAPLSLPAVGGGVLLYGWLQVHVSALRAGAGSWRRTRIGFAVVAALLLVAAAGTCVYVAFR